MNFKALALSATIAVGSILGGVQSAMASTCWFPNGNNGRLSATYCATNTRTNANGHRVVDLVDHEGTRVTLVFWVENAGDQYGSVEILGLQSGRVVGDWWLDEQGDRRIETPNGFQMALRM